MDLKKKRITVTGGKGFLGTHLVRKLREDLECEEVFVAGRPEYDLRDLRDIERMYDEQRPDVVIHLAGVVGGIGANRENPGKFFYDNAIMGILLLPILETAVTVFRRAINGQGIFTADTDHFHYRFLRKGFSETKTTLFLISISFLFSLTGILFEFVKPQLRLILFILICVICFLLLTYLGYHNILPRNKKNNK